VPQPRQRGRPSRVKTPETVDPGCASHSLPRPEAAQRARSRTLSLRTSTTTRTPPPSPLLANARAATAVEVTRSRSAHPSPWLSVRPACGFGLSHDDAWTF
jgi:hypothetical protein